MKAKSDKDRVTVRLLKGEVEKLKQSAHEATRSVGAQARVLILLGLNCINKASK